MEAFKGSAHTMLQGFPASVQIVLSSHCPLQPFIISPFQELRCTRIKYHRDKYVKAIGMHEDAEYNDG